MAKKSPRFIASELGASYGLIKNILVELGYAEEDGDELKLTDKGRNAGGTYTDRGSVSFDTDVINEISDYLNEDSVRCWNCGKILIPNGGRISTATGYYDCPYCGSRNEVDKN